MGSHADTSSSGPAEPGESAGGPEGRDGVVVACRGLVKRFGAHMAVDGLDLEVHRGQFFGLLGPNGAGKSTTVSLLTGMQLPTAGEIRLFGRRLDPDDPVVKGQMGVVTEEPPLFDRLRGREQLQFTARMHGLSRGEASSRAADILGILGLGRSSETLVADYSRGMRKKLAIGCALIHAPGMLFLDEPFEGVDALSGETIRGVLEHLTARGTTVLLTTHILTIAERICDRFGILHRGRLVWEGDREDLAAGGKDLTGRFREAVGAEATEQALPSWLGGG